MNIQIIKAYLRIHEWCHVSLNFNLPGIGVLLKTIKQDFLVDFTGKKLFVNHKVIDNYARLINARFNEPETHKFIKNVFQYSGDKKYRVIEVGGNIGEFVIDFGDHPSVNEFIVFEPNPECYKGIHQTVGINNFNKVKLIQKVVADFSGKIKFNLKEWETSSGSISDEDNMPELECTSLDDVIKEPGISILLIDAEGAELRIMKGGKEFIRNNYPFIIFEYNHVSKQHFSYQEVQEELGPEYQIYRLRMDGLLDKVFKRTWNLVAIHKDEEVTTNLLSEKKK